MIIDATERRTQRPKDHDRQKDLYSGKKKGHTYKNTIICDLNKFVHFLGRTAMGKVHDLKLLDIDLSSAKDILKCCEILVDLGYLGLEKYIEVKELFIPHKKPKKSKQNPETKLTDDQKDYNKCLSSVRVAVEHAIGGMKHLGILVQVFRNRVEDFEDLVIEIATGIWNLKVSH